MMGRPTNESLYEKRRRSFLLFCMEYMKRNPDPITGEFALDAYIQGWQDSTTSRRSDELDSAVDAAKELIAEMEQQFNRGIVMSDPMCQRIG